MKLITFLSHVLALSYNQPKFCPNASWNPNAITFAGSNIVGNGPFDIFVSTNNTIYVTNQQYGKVVVWSEGSVIPTRNISGNLLNPYGLFVTTAGDIYVDSANPTGRVDKWTLNSTIGIPTMYTCGKCFDLFLDISNTLYCSMLNVHQVLTKSLNNLSNPLTIVAGTSIPGSTSYMLDNPRGIFVDINFDLYVADWANNRIQLFRSGQLSATTAVGSASLNPTIALNHPSGIVPDADGYLFIVDSWNCRVIGSGPNGFRCLVGCSGGGSASNQLNYPYALRFDSYGNMFIADNHNNRIQKFLLLTNSCGK